MARGRVAAVRDEQRGSQVVPYTPAELHPARPIREAACDRAATGVISGRLFEVGGKISRQSWLPPNGRMPLAAAPSIAWAKPIAGPGKAGLFYIKIVEKGW